jgi:hypothetical protein
MLFIALTFLGCGGEEPLTPGPDDPRYTARGRIIEIQGEGPMRLIEIHHEVIASFVDADGNPAPMESMTMPFAVAEGVSFSEGAGDSIEFEFAVRWNLKPMLLLTRVATLPNDTKLEL